MDDATTAQVLAADPTAATWLSANAGSGKTRVLTDRVARLLLRGVQPQNILCLTYTKAAASEMQNRLFQRLGDWAMKPVDALREELEVLGVQDVQGPETLADARRLFARAIETPGGLRIQTIHSYCASLLRRFPLEAGVSPNFQEMDDRSASTLSERVIELIAERAPDVIDALAEHLTGDDIETVIKAVLNEREAFAVPKGQAEILNWFGLPPSFGQKDLIEEVFAPGDSQLLMRTTKALLSSNKSTDTKAGLKLRSVDWQSPTLSDIEMLCGLFLFGESAKAPFAAKISTFPTKDCRASLGDDQEPLANLMLRVEAVRDKLLSFYAAQKSAALHSFAKTFLPLYENEKANRGWLDFDDLILKTRALLSDERVAQWVLYKLDGGLDHILVDEAQDTSPAQWQVIERLAQELTSGLGARDDSRRTIFVVGDKKQSIYSFQGADPEEFDTMREHFEERLIDSDTPLNRRELQYSFRSSDAILRFVDNTVTATDMRHCAFHETFPGRVDLWPAVPETEKPEAKNWYDPVDLIAQDHHSVILAREVAQFMKRTIGKETIPTTKGDRRLVKASDFLILVRRRSALFQEIIRACKALNLPVAGADRLKLGAELAVKDLTAILSFLATPEDDLSLAEALKSPLFGWTEQMLYDLAAGRKNAYLWHELRQRSEEFPDTFAILRDLRNQADFLRPYDMIERVLTRHDGRRKLLARLGAEAEDGIDALLSQSLNYERMEVPSLTGFITWMQTDDVEVKRQLDTAGDLIRVMTVHGAKGLEAPIVILPETAKIKTRASDQVIDLAEGKAAWKVNAERQPEVMKAALTRQKEDEQEEQERLFYVAATRAETWLIFAAAGDVGDGQESWYAKAKSGLEAMDADTYDTGTQMGLGLRFAHGDWSSGQMADMAAQDTPVVDLPNWVHTKAALVEKEPPARSPSDLGGAKALPGKGGQDEETAKRHGSMVHRLLEEGPGILHGGLAEQLLEAEFGDFDPKEAITEAQRVLETSKFRSLFADDALSEVDLTADLPGLGRLTGTIDKLIVESTQVTAIDFKTNAVVPASADQVPSGILRQMGAYQAMLETIYPNKTIEVAILWTADPQLMGLPHEIVRNALQDASTS